MKRAELDQQIALASARQHQRWVKARHTALTLRTQALRQLQQSPVVFIGATVLLLWAWRRLRGFRLFW